MGSKKPFGEYGCSVDLALGEALDDCVLNLGEPNSSCQFALPARRIPDHCPYWIKWREPKDPTQ